LEIDGLLREVIMDKANGFVGRTVIHPSHIKYVNALLSVTREEYEDALAISNSSEGGVFKGNNKMNEVTPHSSWAYKTLMRARAFGVIESAKSYWELLELNGFSQ
jgi:citrate lyase beta subunit